MSIRVVCPVILVISFISLSAFSQSNQLIGEWALILLKNENEHGKQKKTQKQIQKEGIVWKIEFKKDSSLQQASNLARDTISSVSGKWRSVDGILEFEMNVDGRTYIFHYQFSINKNELRLIREFQHDPNRIEAHFIKVK